MVKIAVYPGTFDPITYGHMDVIERSLRLFDQVIVAIASDRDKTPFFGDSERLEIIRQIFGGVPSVRVEVFSGLLVHFMQKERAHIIVQGIRTHCDMAYEFQLAMANQRLKSDVETVYLRPSEQFTHISSSLVREIATMGGDLSSFVHGFVVDAFNKKLF